MGKIEEIIRGWAENHTFNLTLLNLQESTIYHKIVQNQKVLVLIPIKYNRAMQRVSYIPTCIVRPAQIFEKFEQIFQNSFEQFKHIVVVVCI